MDHRIRQYTSLVYLAGLKDATFVLLKSLAVPVVLGKTVHSIVPYWRNVSRTVAKCQRRCTAP